MLVLRITAGFVALALLAMACGTATPSPTPGEGAPINGPTQPTPMAPSPAPVAPTPPVDQQAAIDSLCDPEKEANLANVAGRLDNFEQAEQQALNPVIDEVRINLEALALGPDGMGVRDSAIGLLGDLRAGIEDAETRAATTSAAAMTLREMETHICPAPER